MVETEVQHSYCKFLEAHQLKSFIAWVPRTYHQSVKRGELLGAKLITLGLWHQENAVGVALLKIIDGLESFGQLVWIYIDKAFRNKGLSECLLKESISVCTKKSCTYLIAEFDSDCEGALQLEKVFSKMNDHHAESYGIACHCSTKKILSAPWVQRTMLPSDFEVQLWKDVSGEEKHALKTNGLNELNVPKELSPFRDEDIIEKLNSMVLKYKNSIIGWQMNHRISQDTIRYTAIFIKESLQPFGLILPLLGLSIQRQFSSSQLWANKAVFMVPHTMQNMEAFVEKRFKNYVDKCVEIKSLKINLNHV